MVPRGSTVLTGIPRLPGLVRFHVFLTLRMTTVVVMMVWFARTNKPAPKGNATWDGVT
jgi:hypothetical protein